MKQIVYVKLLYLFVSGDESLATELRVRTMIELAAWVDVYLQQYHDDKFEEYCGVSYDEAVKDCSTDGGYASVWTICALASVIARPIVSVYPLINGVDDVLPIVLNKTMRPRRPVTELHDNVYIMWTRAEEPTDRGVMWTSNHFVPLARYVNGTSPSSAAAASISSPLATASGTPPETATGISPPLATVTGTSPASATTPGISHPTPSVQETCPASDGVIVMETSKVNPA